MPTRSALSIRIAHALVRIGLLPASLIFAACACPGPARPGTDAAPGAAAGITTEMAAAGPILSRLYFGTASPDGPVSPADFEAFLDTCVTPRFPLGLTRYAAGLPKPANASSLRA